MLRQARPLVSVLCASLVLAACAGSPTSQGATQLQPTGWTLAGVPPAEPSYPAWLSGIVADGEGQIWARGPWQLVRVDPKSGEATIWDAADDTQFASTSMLLAPAQGAGVWLLDGARVRLFDGERFAVDVEVPREVRNLPGGPDSDGWVTDVVQVGSELWVSVLDLDQDQGDNGTPLPGSGGQVARLVDGGWSVLSEPDDGVGGSLTVDEEGGVWAGGVVLQFEFMEPDASLGELRRWDGDGWSRPGADPGQAPTESGEVVADPTGGVWFVSEADGLWHLTEAGGTAVSPGLNRWAPATGALVVSSSGVAWLVHNEDSLVEVSAEGAVREHGTAESVALGAGDAVVIQQVPALLRLAEGEAEQLWQGGLPIGWGWGYGLVASAQSVDELWVKAGGDTWYRLRDGAWDTLAAGSDCATVAADGALWTTDLQEGAGEPSGGQLGRTTSQGYREVGDRPVACGYGAESFAGPDGSVWVLQDEDVVQVWPDGRRAAVGRPASVDPALSEDYGAAYDEQVCLHGVDPTGAVWVSEFSDVDDEECTAGTWHRWDGQAWQATDEPDPFASAREKVVAGDGIGWALRDAPSRTATEIARYADGTLRPIATAPGFGSLTAVSGGRACAFEYPARDSIVAQAVVCFDADGEVARFSVARGLDFDSHYAVAPDGAVWLVGPQVARLQQTLPGS